MKILLDPAHALGDGLAAIRTELQLPTHFSPEVEAAAQAAIERPLSDHVDRTALPFVTLDPASSTDLDQAFAIEAAGADLLLRYAIADVAWFVDDGDPIDQESWLRGTTITTSSAGFCRSRAASRSASACAVTNWFSM